MRATAHSINQERYHYHRHFKSITKQTWWRQNQITFALVREEETLVSLDLHCLLLFYFCAFKHNEPFVLPSLSTCGCCCILKTAAHGVSLTETLKSRFVWVSVVVQYGGDNTAAFSIDSSFLLRGLLFVLVVFGFSQTRFSTLDSRVC